MERSAVVLKFQHPESFGIIIYRLIPSYHFFIFSEPQLNVVQVHHLCRSLDDRK